MNRETDGYLEGLMIGVLWGVSWTIADIYPTGLLIVASVVLIALILNRYLEVM